MLSILLLENLTKAYISIKKASDIMNETKVTSLLELIQGPSERPFLGPTSDEDNSTYDNEVEGINEALEAVK